MKEIADQIGRAVIFNKLPADELKALATLAQHRKFKTGEFVCHQGDHWPKALFLQSGRLRWAMLSVSGKEQVLYMVEAGRSFWGHTLFDDQPMPASLMAAQTSSAYLWSRDDLLPVLNRNPQALWEITGIQVGIMRQAREIIYGLAFKPVAGRLAQLLLDRSSGQENTPWQRDLTLSEIASFVSTSQEVVCRLLYQFQADGILEIDRATITLRDRHALEHITSND